jgi:hypothetical protein
LDRALFLLEPIPLGAEVIDLRQHSRQQKLSRCSRYAGALELQDLLTLLSELGAHVLDFGTDAIQAHSAPSLPSEWCGQALPPCALERTFGTMLGLFVATALLWLQPLGLPLIGCIVALQFVGQLFAVTNYALAVFFFTPMALLMATAANQSSFEINQLLVARGLDTIIGCGIGLAVLLATYRTESVTARNALSQTLGAANSVLPFLSRGDVTTAEARVARRRLRFTAFNMVQLYEEQAGGTARAREEADRASPAMVATQRLAFRVLAACWEIEAAGDAAKACSSLLLGPDGERAAVQAIASLQAGHAAEISSLAANFLKPEIAALNEAYPHEIEFGTCAVAGKMSGKCRSC